MSSPRSIIALLGSLAILAAPAGAQAKSAPRAHGRAAASCASASARPASASLAAIRSATLCLLNVERANHGLRPLHSDSRLQAASVRHSRDMVAGHFFAHGDFFGRIRRAGYLSGAHAYTVGENLAWGGGPLATPQSIVQMWMHSPPHRANILNGRYAAIGIGVVRGTPTGIAGATYTTDFGYRR